METAAPSAEPRRECTLIRYRVSCCRSAKQWLLLDSSTTFSSVCLSKHTTHKLRTRRHGTTVDVSLIVDFLQSITFDGLDDDAIAVDGRHRPP